ncbi:MAG TPA: hypothetical protein VJ276_24810 [Thermoanaerobaculia bacterium]|nr:hypothetical protein [Thermoanaerobaculia bacterium]
MKVTVEELTDHLSDVLDKVRDGDTVTILEADKPLATLAPVAQASAPSRRLGDFRPIPLPEPIDFDPLEFLMKDRLKDRSR